MPICWSKVQSPFTFSYPRVEKHKKAFSLVEVALALGMTSFGLLSMIALLPLGLMTARKAADLTTQAQIVQFARNQMELTSFTNLASWNTVVLYFDNQGLPTTVNDPQRIYTATFNVTNVNFTANAATPTDILGPNTHLNNIANAQTVQVNITNRTVIGGTQTNVFPIVVPNAGF